MEKGHVYYIKLGDGQHPEIARKCIEDDLLWLGFIEAPEDVIQEVLLNEQKSLSKDWKESWEPVRKKYPDKNSQTQTNYAKAIRQFYTATEDDYFFTFLNSTMYYCHPVGDIIPITESNTLGCFTPGSRIRATTGWKNCAETDESIKLSERNLSGLITKKKIYRGTICGLKEEEQKVFIHTLQQRFPESEKMKEAQAKIPELIKYVIHLLNDKDFEILVDMLLTKSGWRRVGEVGGTQKAIDMQYRIPITNETIYVQVKSVLDDNIVNKALKKLTEVFKDKENVTCYIVYHTLENDVKETIIPPTYENLLLKTLNRDALAKLCAEHQEVIDWLYQRTTGKFQ